MSEELFISPPLDPEALFFFNTFSPEDQVYTKRIWLQLVEEGSEPRLAERDAVAAMLQHHRLHAPRMSAAELQGREKLAKLYESRGIDPEKAEQKALPKSYLRKVAQGETLPKEKP